jgi:uncharacterized protein
MTMRVLFVADVHGADVILRKSLRAVAEYDASVLILAGDLSGKSLYPIVRREDGSFSVQRRSGVATLSSSAVAEFEQELANRGQYFFHCTTDDLTQLKKTVAAIDEIFTRKIIDRLEIWKDLITSRLDLRRVRVFITPGNDDPFELDDILSSFEPLGILSHVPEPHDLGSNEMITLDFTNPTPWSTPREVSERELSRRIGDKICKLKRPERAIFNFHCPPFRTKLDLAPKLDKNLRPVTGPGTETQVHVGSTAVRKAIEEVQPVLSLHGHIHESAGEDSLGRTICLNPGSEYWTGILHAYLVEIDEGGNLKNYIRVEG